MAASGRDLQMRELMDTMKELKLTIEQEYKAEKDEFYRQLGELLNRGDVMIRRHPENLESHNCALQIIRVPSVAVPYSYFP